MARKKKNIQQGFRQEQFKHNQFWNISYTEKYKDGSEKDFKTVIKAKSYDHAKEILLLKLEEDDPSIKAKAIQGFMFHKTYVILSPVRKLLGVKEWEHIHNAAFPNENNVLFKLEMPRPIWKTNRFNGSGKNNLSHIKKFGFKKGKENWSYIHKKGKSLPLSERSDKLYHGKWVEWDEEDRNEKKNEIIEALLENDNCRDRAARFLGISRSQFYRFLNKFTEVDWENEYPTSTPKFPIFTKEEYSEMAKKAWVTMKANGTIPFGGKSNTPKVNAKRSASIKKTMKERRIKKFKKLEPEIREALSANGNCRKKAAKYLGMKAARFMKYLHGIKKELGINWSEEYPTKYYKIK